MNNILSEILASKIKVCKIDCKQTIKLPSTNDDQLLLFPNDDTVYCPYAYKDTCILKETTNGM